MADEIAARRDRDEIDVDVLVTGGGPAGLGAALGASRLGAKTLLVERFAFLGGVAAIGLGMTINQMRPNGKPRSKIHEALIGRIQGYGDAAIRIEGHAVITNTEYLKLAAMQALEDAGCEYQLYSLVSDAIVESGVVKGAILSTKSGPIRINARRVVDATGDGDLAYFAGCPMAKGREDDGFLSPMTSLFVLGGVDLKAARPYVRDKTALDSTGEVNNLLDLLAEGREAGYRIPASVDMTRAVYPDAVVVNHSGTRHFEVLDGTNSRDLTKAERYLRELALDFPRFLKDRAIPGFEHAYLEQVSAWTGVRETRRIVGDYVLTEQDAKTGAHFPDAIARRFGFLDIGFVRFEEMTPHDVPYRALLPRGFDNILASGRSISASHVAASAGKSMGNCMATGHAAGVAAALSIREGVSVRNLGVDLLRQTLADDGVPLGG